MMNKTIVRTLIIALAAGLSFAGITACDGPEEVEEPVAQEAPDGPDLDEGPDEPIDQPQLGEADGPEPGAAPQGQPPQMPGAGEEVSDEELDNFADAIEAVSEFQEQADDPQARLQAAESQEEMQQIQQELMGEMQQAVEGAGMQFQEFMILTQRLQQDPELRQRLEERVDLEELMGPAPDQQPQQRPAPGPAPGQ